MKIFTAQQLAEADRQTIKNEGITSLALMERAATRAYKIITEGINPDSSVKIFCGIGNNGGDGLVIARKLIEQGFAVEVFIVNYSDHRTEEFKANLERLKDTDTPKIKELSQTDNFPDTAPDDILIDAIFGIGLNRPLPDWVNNLVEHLNDSAGKVIAIDMPTGLFSDRIPKDNQQIIKAHLTLCFQSPKLVFYLPQTAGYVGNLKIIPIGLDKDYLANTSTKATLTTQKVLAPYRKKRKKFSHKGTYGHCVTIGGSYGKMGSMVLATKAALRAGAGKITGMIPKCGYEIMQTCVPESMTLTYGDGDFISGFEDPGFTPESVAFGMGAGTNRFTAEFLLEVLKARETPMLIDADGINLLAQHKKVLVWLPKGSVLTPHPKELAGLVGEWEDDFDKIEKTRAFAKKYEVTMLIKGANTLIINEEHTYINPTGNPGMATAGCGDVLSGIIAGLMAQGHPNLEAAILGVYLHGRAGDLAAEASSQESMMAGDLLQHLGTAFKELQTP